MKFWELISAFRTERNLLDTVFANQFEHGFSDHYANFDTLVDSQNREILDAAVPDVLVELVAARSMQTFSLSNDGTLRSAKNPIGNQTPVSYTHLTLPTTPYV